MDVSRLVLAQREYTLAAGIVKIALSKQSLEPGDHFDLPTDPGVFGFIDADGKPHSGREAIDLQWLRTFLPDGNLEPGMPDGAVMGHLHLRVSSMEENLAFYRDQIGFTPNMFSSEIGMYDLSAGGSFPHRLAGNIWESGGRPQRPAGSDGVAFPLDRADSFLLTGRGFYRGTQSIAFDALTITPVTR